MRKGIVSAILLFGLLTGLIILPERAASLESTQITINSTGYIEKNTNKYTMYLLEKTCYIKSDSTGNLIASDPDPSKVISAFLEIVSSGELNVKTGIYDFGITETFQPSIVLKGKSDIQFIAETDVVFLKTRNILWYFEDSQNIVIQGFNFFFTTHSGANAIFFNGTNNNIVITRNTFDVETSDCIWEDPDLIYGDPNSNNSTGLLIQDNVILNSCKDAISIYGASNCLITNNSILSFGMSPGEACAILFNGQTYSVDNNYVGDNKIFGPIGSTGLKVGIGFHEGEKSIVIKNNIIYNTNIGIGLWENAGDCIIEENAISLQAEYSTVDSIGIVIVGQGINSPSFGNRIINNNLENIGGNGILVKYVSSTDISKNTVDTSFGIGIVSAYCAEVNIYNNTVNHTEDSGIQLYFVNESRVENNFVSKGGNCGIYLGNSNVNIISSNVIEFSIHEGIIISTSNFNTIENNKISYSTDYGILVQKDSKENILIGNQFLDNKLGDIKDLSP